MERKPLPASRTHDAHALFVWLSFIAAAFVGNRLIPALSGQDVKAWTYSSPKSFYFAAVIYAALMFVVPLLLTKGYRTVRRPGFLIPFLTAVLAIALWETFRGITAVALIVIVYLHWRYDLSGLGIRSRGLKGDIVAILLLGFLGIAAVVLQSDRLDWNPVAALGKGFDRLFANPASSIENMFYFGFITSRLSKVTGRVFTPFIVGAMYTFHEITNPEYWYEGVDFVVAFVAVTISAFFFLWRRSTVVIWLGDGLATFLRRLV